MLLDKMNFGNDILNKISWRTFLEYAMKELADKYQENTEVP